jgi:hypothetical protein
VSKSEYKVWVIAAVCLGLAGTLAWAADGSRETAVQFAKGESAVTLKDRIKGDESVDYRLGAAAGQTMTVTLKPSNRSTYFNVMAPGEDSAIFIGSREGNKFSGKLRKSGDYVVRVHQMRNAARRNEPSSDSIEFKIAADVPGAAAAPAPRS